MLRARLPPGDFETQSLAVQVVRQIGKPALVGAVTHPTRVVLRSERLNFLPVTWFRFTVVMRRVTITHD